MPTPLAVVCDFDGTATLLDIGDEISKHFGGVEHWETETARFRRGELDTRGIIEAIYAKVLASEEEVRAFAAATARLRPGFSDLVAACRARGAPFFLASGGLRQYIEAVLAANLAPDLRAHVRYPETLFKVQAEIYRTFHMIDPQAFYNKEDLWDLEIGRAHV